MNSEDNNIYALSIADAMAGMMLILLMALLAIYLQLGEVPNKSAEIFRLERELKDAQERNKNEAKRYFSMKKEIYDALTEEFSVDLNKWNARIDKNTLAFILENNDNGFKAGSDKIPPQFTEMLNQFVPRYIKVIRKYDQYIEEIRVEGHTSSEWGTEIVDCVDNNDESCQQSAYVKNMELSQARAMSVLNHILIMPNINENRAWVRAKLAANGLSSSHLLCGVEKKPCISGTSEKENKEASRRVEFSIRTNAENKMEELLHGKN